MTKKHFLFAVYVLILLTTCSSDGDAPQAVVIPYTVTVSYGNATRTTLNSSKQMIFETGDKLVVTGTDISGTLTLSDGNGERTAKFNGSLTWSGTGTPANNLALSATLNGNGASSPFTQTGIAATFADAFQKYSLLQTETPSTYADRAFQLKQQSTFVIFDITFTDGTAANTTFDVTVSDDSHASIATSTTTTAIVGSDVKATFTLALPGGTTLTKAKATLVAGAATHQVNFGGDSYTFVKNYYYTSTSTVLPYEVVVQSSITIWSTGTGDSGNLEI